MDLNIKHEPPQKKALKRRLKVATFLLDTNYAKIKTALAHRASEYKLKEDIYFIASKQKEYGYEYLENCDDKIYCGDCIDSAMVSMQQTTDITPTFGIETYYHEQYNEQPLVCNTCSCIFDVAYLFDEATHQMLWNGEYDDVTPRSAFLCHIILENQRKLTNVNLESPWLFEADIKAIENYLEYLDNLNKMTQKFYKFLSNTIVS
jgi:phage anti-repressor protein